VFFRWCRATKIAAFVVEPDGDDLIFYPLHATGVRIFRILHGGHDYGALLFPE